MSTRHADGRARERGRTVVQLIILVALTIAMGLGIFYGWTKRLGPNSVIIRSEPPGATIFVNEVYLGVTPLQTRSLPRGRHSLKLVKHGFQPARTMFEVGTLQTVRLDIRLAPERRYNLTVVSTPPGASVSLDGIPTGQRTPTKLANLRAGRYDILLTADGYLPFGREVEVGEKHPNKIEAALQSRMETYYQDAIRAQPLTITNYTELAHHYVITNQFEKAGHTLKQGIELACRPAGDRKQVARLQQEIKKIYYGGFDFGGEEAMEKVRPILERVLQEVTDSCPTALVPYQLLAAMYASTGKAQEAAEVLEKGVKNVPDNRTLLFYYARTLCRLGDYDKAVAPLEKLVSLSDRNPSARTMLAEIYNRMGKTDLAIRHREKIAELMKRNPRAATGALVSLAALSHRKRAYVEAAKKWEQAALLQKDAHMKAQFQMSAANEYALAGQQAKARAMLKKVIKSAPNVDIKEQAQERLRHLQEQRR